MERVSGPAAGKKSPFRRNCTQANLPRLWRISLRFGGSVCALADQFCALADQSALWRISLRFGGSVCALADQFCALADQ
ncbi:MAG: hypothetical protein E7029_03355, partial [Planctomycetaceae bacterium]|nr:hypothetical protein [Planctomycetaceae bacterium]